MSDSSAGVLEAVRGQLQRWAISFLPDEAPEVTDVSTLPGNSGLGFTFTVLSASGEGQRLVVRLAPPGVRRSGNTDVLSQVPLLAHLQRVGFPVARVRWSSDDPTWFGSDALVQEHVPGRPLHLWDANLSAPTGTGGTRPALQQAIQALATLHATAWCPELEHWGIRRSASEEVAFWGGLLRRADPDGERLGGRELARRLEITAPKEVPAALVHGDYQTNNLLYDDTGRLLAVIDWEITTIGPWPLDVAWLALFSDPSCWHPDWAGRMRVREDPSWIREAYECAAGRALPAFGWFRALACYRFGAIAAFNLMLHRQGRRHDPLYEQVESSIEVLFDRGADLLGDLSGHLDPSW